MPIRRIGSRFYRGGSHPSYTLTGRCPACGASIRVELPEGSMYDPQAWLTESSTGMTSMTCPLGCFYTTIDQEVQTHE